MSEPNVIKTKFKISQTEEIEVPVYFEMSSFVPSVIAQHMSVQGVSNNILVSFYELDVPIFIDPNPEAIEELKREGYAAECVARITIPEAHFIDMANVFTQVAERIKSKREGKEDANTKPDEG